MVVKKTKNYLSLALICVFTVIALVLFWESSLARALIVSASSCLLIYKYSDRILEVSYDWVNKIIDDESEGAIFVYIVLLSFCVLTTSILILFGVSWVIWGLLS